VLGDLPVERKIAAALSGEMVAAVLGGGNLKIKAFAGAGKTSTLRLIAG
jgi:ABC-type transport system involved in cytochrome c biogenesis ATPase subunit